MTAAILAMGAVTSIGLSAETAAAAYHADLPNHRDHPFFVDARGAPVSMAYVDGVQPLAEAERIAALATAAVAELARSLPPRDLEVDLLLALPAARPGIDEVQLGPAVVAACQSAAPRLRVGSVRIGHFDQAGGVMALGAARTAAANRPQLVVGADSLIGPDALDWLEASNRLLHPGNMFGLIPGEAAGALLVGSPDAIGLRGLAGIVGSGLGRETQDVAPGPWIGRALMRAMKAATEGMAEAGVRPGHLFADLNGEPWRADTLGHALPQVSPGLDPEVTLHILANRTGEIGAAFGIIATILAILGRRTGFLASRHALVSGMSWGNARGAAVLDLGPEGKLWE